MLIPYDILQYLLLLDGLFARMLSFSLRLESDLWIATLGGDFRLDICKLLYTVVTEQTCKIPVTYCLPFETVKEATGYNHSGISF